MDSMISMGVGVMTGSLVTLQVFEIKRSMGSNLMFGVIWGSIVIIISISTFVATLTKIWN